MKLTSATLQTCLTLLASALSPLAHSFAFATVPTPASDRYCASSKSSSPLKMSSATDATSTTTKDRPYGAWESPITSQSITAGSVRIGDLHVVGDSVYWLEGRPLEGGRNVFCKWTGDGDAVEEITPKETNVRTRVHEYGGSATLIAGGDTLYFIDFATQQIRSMPLVGDEEEPRTVTTGPPGRYRYANAIYDASRKALVCVREDHGPDGKADPKDVVNQIVAVEVETGAETVLVTGYDFAASPQLSKDGTKLACIVWDHPNMPWDATKLVTVDVPGGGLFGSDVEIGSPTVIAGQDGDTSVMQPLYHPETGDLMYISDETGYYNLYRNSDGGSSTNLLPMDADFGGASPGWMLGQMGFSVLPDGKLAATVSRDGSSVLMVLDVVGWDGEGTIGRDEYGSADGLPRQFGSVKTGSDGSLYFGGGDPSTPSSVYRWSMTEKKPATILKSSSKTRFDPSVISVPRQIEFPTTLGTAYGYYYPPKNGDFECTTEKAPPLLVKAHGGPTSAASTAFNAQIQYWTSRGFAVVDVDYGGSTGYGRDFRRRLRKSWGIVDIDDVCNAAKHLVDEGLADGEKLCIDGGSAGGYTTLGALAFKDVFKAGCSLYGVADLSLLASDTHKFESRYLDGLVGAYPEEKDVYDERSPLLSVDTLNCPILLLQGDEDKIVPPNQAERMHEALLSKGIPTCLKIYEGEQHGFRKSENIEDALDSELAFYGRVFGINVPGAIDLDIDNM